MSVWRRAQSDLPSGLYDEVVTGALAARLKQLGAARQADIKDIKDPDIDEQLLALVRDAAAIALANASTAEDKLALASRLLAVFGDVLRPGEAELLPQWLRGIAPNTAGSFVHPDRPRGSLLGSSLLTNAPGDSVLEHLASEFDSADRIDLLCAFIKLSGLDKFRPLIEKHRLRGRPLRVLTTTYMHATDAAAIDLLHRLGAEVRISYDDMSTRLHAKAWIFHRDSEYATAYVGSSNLSHAAQTSGLEWNVRIAQADQPEVVEDMVDVFESYWRDGDKFQPYDGSPEARTRLVAALTERATAGQTHQYDLEPKSWQLPILRELEVARAHGRNRNLVVAATGTGKTLLAAFDYDRMRRDNQVDTLLFVAHRKEILDQARQAFRDVLRLQTFGERWVDGDRPTDFRHVFASVQSLQNAELEPDRFDCVIIDEVHHAAADTYDKLLERLKPKQLVGLTATPERADGKLYDKHFPRPYIGNLRVWDAIGQQILVPFRYFVLDVGDLDLTDVRWNGGYVDSDLSQRLIRAADVWTRTLVKAMAEYVARPESLRALAFCVDKAHAAVVAEQLSQHLGLETRVLTDATPREERDRAKSDLTAGRVQVLCVVDLFNEGVDIPDVNTLLLFRPTESATVFQQQLGRGLRRSRNKDILTVLDVTGRQHPRFRFDRNLRVLLGHSPRELREFVETGFGRLPSGCTVRFEERAQKDILERIRRAIPSDLSGMRELLREHRQDGWVLETFLAETEVDLLDLYRANRSWTSLRAEVGICAKPEGVEAEALSNVSKLLHVTDTERLGVWRRLLDLDTPESERDRRLAAMLFVVLYGRDLGARQEDALAHWAGHDLLRDELRQLLPVLAMRADSLPQAAIFDADVPLAVHGRYLDVELSAAFQAISKKEGKFRNFYTGVEPVCDGRFDLLLVTLDKGGVAHEHLRYHDFALGPTTFQWQSQAGTRQDDARGNRHLRPVEAGVTPLLFVRDSKKDARGVTNAFRFLGPVLPAAWRGERPITIEWQLAQPLAAEWLRRWSKVA